MSDVQYPNFLDYVQTTLKEGEGKKPVASFSVDLPASATFLPEGGLSLVFYWGVKGVEQGLPIALELSAEAINSLRRLLSHEKTPGETVELTSQQPSQ